MLSPSKPINIMSRSRSSNGGDTETCEDEGCGDMRYSASGNHLERMSFRSGSLAARAKNTKNLSLTGAAPRPICTAGTSRTSPSSPRTMRQGKTGARLLALDTSFHRLNLQRTGSLPHVNQVVPQTPMVARSSVQPTSLVLDRESQDLDFYPDGPICIDPPNLWLYSAPDATLAREFDLVINVAHEIPCPFEERAAAAAAAASAPCHVAGRPTGMTSPETAALARQNEHDASCTSLDASSIASAATTPNSIRTNTSPATTGSACGDCGVFLLDSPNEAASSNGGEGQVEYVHIPWQHNQAFASELSSIIALMEDRIGRCNKRTLVHCQQGISRSASLVIAYVMKTRRMGLNEAYTYVKQRSENVGPNMSLIYQLTDWGVMVFGSGVARDDPSSRPVSINLSEHTSSSTIVPSPVAMSLDSPSPQTKGDAASDGVDESEAGDRLEDDRQLRRRGPQSMELMDTLAARLPSHCTYRRYDAVALGRSVAR